MSIRALLLQLLTLGVFIGCLTAAAVPSADAPNGRIAGGHETHIRKHPYQVSVRLDTYILLHICGGSVYAPRVIVTAAHCIKGRFASTIRIVAGKTSILDDSSELGLRVTKLIPHSGYNKKTHENDVGLIILAEPLSYNDAVQPIALAKSEPAAGTIATVTGWGKSEEEAETLTSVLQEVEVQVIDSSVCHSQYKTKDYVITEQMVCAGVENGGKDACQGDSGGPLTADGDLLGIVSWGIGCARSGFPGVYASVPHHAQWIEDSAKAYL